MCVALIAYASYPMFGEFQKNFAGEIIDPNHLIKLELTGKGNDLYYLSHNKYLTWLHYHNNHIV